MRNNRKRILEVNMRRQRNKVQTFIRFLFRWTIAIPLWLVFVLPMFKQITYGMKVSGYQPPIGKTALAVVISIVILWFANTIAMIFHILPQWERIVLLRLGRSVGQRGPGFFIIPPFIYSIAQTIDIRIRTYEVKATRTLTRDNVPIDVTAAVELEIENPEKAAIAVLDYWKTTEWASMEALKSSIGKNDLRPLLSETDAIASSVKKEIDEAAVDFGVNVRAVRITDISAPDTLIEELAVIARAERSSKAKQIQAEAEKKVAEQLVEASKLIDTHPNAMNLRQIQALLEMSKEESSTIIIYPMNSLNGELMANAAAGSKAVAKSQKTRTVKLTPPG